MLLKLQRKSFYLFRLGELTNTNLSLDSSSSQIPGLDSSHPGHPGSSHSPGHSYLPSILGIGHTPPSHYRHPATSDIYAQVSINISLLLGICIFISLHRYLSIYISFFISISLTSQLSSYNALTYTLQDGFLPY